MFFRAREICIVGKAHGEGNGGRARSCCNRV